MEIKTFCAWAIAALYKDRQIILYNFIGVLCTNPTI